jgi:hypothetical protein
MRIGKDPDEKRSLPCNTGAASRRRAHSHAVDAARPLMPQLLLFVTALLLPPPLLLSPLYM